MLNSEPPPVTCPGCRAASNLSYGYTIGSGNLLTASSAQWNAEGSLMGSCTSDGNACFNSLQP